MHGSKEVLKKAEEHENKLLEIERQNEARSAILKLLAIAEQGMGEKLAAAEEICSFADIEIYEFAWH